MHMSTHTPHQEVSQHSTPTQMVGNRDGSPSYRSACVAEGAPQLHTSELLSHEVQEFYQAISRFDRLASMTPLSIRAARRCSAHAGSKGRVGQSCVDCHFRH